MFACVHTQLISSILLGIGLSVHNTTTSTDQSLQVFHACIEQNIDQTQMGSRKETLDLANGHEETEFKLNVAHC